MPIPVDETNIKVKHNEHSPNCSCVECTQRRIFQPLGERFLQEETEWISLSTECPFCSKKSQMWNQKDKNYGCMNIHCRKYYEYL